MPKKSKQPQQESKPQAEPISDRETQDYEQHLINKIAKCERVVSELTNNKIWQEIKADYEKTSQGLDMAWAFEDVQSPRFKQMQASKMAVQTFMNLLPAYQNDLEMARKELNVIQNNRDEIKKDYDDEGTVGTQTISTTQGNSYHG